MIALAAKTDGRSKKGKGSAIGSVPGTTVTVKKSCRSPKRLAIEESIRVKRVIKRAVEKHDGTELQKLGVTYDVQAGYEWLVHGKKRSVDKRMVDYLVESYREEMEEKVAAIKAPEFL
jgi:hypothetical protein